MDKKEKDLMTKIQKEKDSFLKYIKKITKLAPEANTKKKKETVNKYIDLAQKHYDNLFNLLNESVTIMNESNEELYQTIIAEAEPNADIQQFKKLKMFEHAGKFTKLIIEEE